MKHEDQEDREADLAAPVADEGHLSSSGGRPQRGRPPVDYRLKRSIECFASLDGSLYLVHEGMGSTYEIADPTPTDRAVLDLLGEGYISKPELDRRLLERGLDPTTVEASIAELIGIGVVESSDRVNPLPPSQAERFDRQLIYMSDLCQPGQIGESLQMKLSNAHVAILGCGGLGSWAACGLACAGVGTLTLIDDDTVELSNLNRQLLFDESDLGRPKVEVAAGALAAHDSSIEIQAVRTRVEGVEQLVDLTDGVDLLIGTADWPPHLLPGWINQACIRTDTPYITAGQFPPLIRVGPTVIPGRTSCLRCQELAASDEYPLYAELTEFRATNPSTASTIGAASGIIGSMIAMDAVHLLTGAIEPASLGTALMMDLRTMEVTPERIPPHPDCECRSPALSAA